MHFDDMDELQRRLHNAAIVAECDGDEWGHAGVMRDAIAEIERLRDELQLASDTARYACDGWNDALMHEGAHMAAKAIEARKVPNA